MSPSGTQGSPPLCLGRGLDPAEPCSMVHTLPGSRGVTRVTAAVPGGQSLQRVWRCSQDLFQEEQGYLGPAQTEVGVSYSHFCTDLSHFVSSLMYLCVQPFV